MKPFALASSSLSIAQQQLLTANDLSLTQLQGLLNQLLSDKAVDFGDIYCQTGQSESWSLSENIVKEGHYHIHQGVGIRVISGEKSGLAYSDELQMSALQQALQSARGIARHQQQGRVQIGASRPLQLNSWQTVNPPSLYTELNPLLSLTTEQKVALLYRLNQKARDADSRIQQVSISLSGSYKIMLVTATDGTLAADVRPLTRLSVSVIAMQNGRRESGSAGVGGRYTYQYLLENQLPEWCVDRAVRRALLNLEAREIQAGVFPIALAAGWSGVLLHEAVGHGLEGDFNRKGTSAFNGKMGQMVASPLCTVVDNGTLENRRGSLTVDDEGTPTQSTILIENGKLVNYLQDKHNAALMGMHPTGNGRRESYACLPFPRMTNTYLQAGQHDPQEIIASIDKGIYAVDFGGGQVDITSGKFVFNATEAYWIENGKLQYPIKGSTLIGNGAEVLQKISMVGNDFALDSGVGSCGKAGQTVEVGVGQPTLRVDGMTVGGSKT